MLCEQYKAVVKAETGKPFPQDPAKQLRGAVEAVFRSWNGARAIAYRVRERISHDLGTAVNVQAMVFGNRDENVGHRRRLHPQRGHGREHALRRLPRQRPGRGRRGRHPQHRGPRRPGARTSPTIHAELLDIFDRLERHYRDMCDTEFTIEQGKLWMLQTRVGKRTGAAALRMAVDMTKGTGEAQDRWKISRREAIMRVTADHLDQVLHPQFAANAAVAIAKGLAASPGAAVGKVYFTADDAADAADRGEEVILVRSETSPEDVHGMMVSEGILTARGGLVSHAAVVARGWGTPAVVGAEAIQIEGKQFSVGDVVVSEGDVISLDGSTGEVILGEVELAAAEPPAEFQILLRLGRRDPPGKLEVRANADNGPDARNARRFGAEGIGLCRTEHMFLGEDRLPVVRRMILARRPARTRPPRWRSCARSRRPTSWRSWRPWTACPVTVRLLDPPLHEFLPDVGRAGDQGEATGRSGRRGGAAAAGRPGTGRSTTPCSASGVCASPSCKPGLYAMQVRALMEAAAGARAEGKTPIVEVMIPLTVTREETAEARAWVEEAIAAGAEGTPAQVTIGTMIETPRAALRADEIAEEADFFSFGTNDLTQMTFGFSRDDVESRMMPAYLELGSAEAQPVRDHRPGGRRRAGPDRCAARSFHSQGPEARRLR